MLANNLPEGLAKPARRALEAAGISQLAQLTRLSESDIKQLHGMGPKAMDSLRIALADQGLSFAIK